MSINHVSFFANVNKSQIKETDTHFIIEGVPVTVDDAVMNGMHYPAEHNKKGMGTITDRVVVLSHPTDVNGKGADAYAGHSLQQFYSGGHIESVYSRNGVWYVNINIDKDILKVQDGKQGADFYKRLTNREDIGVSTGLYTDAKKQSGTNAKGEKYDYVATEQQYNHLAMLNASEPPAGGQATFMRFNGEGADNLVVNLADYMPDSTPSDDPTPNPKDDKEFNSLLAKILALLGVSKLAGNEETENAENAEDKSMKTTAEKMQALKDKGMYKDNMSDDEVSNAYEQMMKKNEDDNKASAENAANDSDLIATVNKLADTVTALNEKVDGLQTQLNQKDEAEKSALVNKLKDLKLGLTENSLKLLPLNELQSMYENATGETISLNGARFESNKNDDSDYEDSFINTEAK